MISKSTIPAPQWLVDSMERLKKMPTPTSEEVRIQFKASEQWEWDCVKEIKKAKYLR